ncbi:LysR family transcriptional regulator [Pseudomonas syringae group genomosp. 3]|nr:LysR family transcriptional regulator [Pseudomonas syringae group genomosp. 3]
MNQLLAMRAFIRVIETGSFSRAALQLHLPRSTVSKLVSDLEQHLRVKLIHRTTRAVAATSEGLEYLAHVSQLVTELDSVDEAMRGHKLRPSGHLRIDAPAAFAVRMLIPALPQFHMAYPDISVSIGITDRTLNLIGEGVDCAIRAGALEDLSLIARRITDMPYATCASPSYLAAHGVPSNPIDVRQNHHLVGYFYSLSGKPEAFVLQQGAERHTFDSARFSANEGNGLTALMLAGLGIGQHLRPMVQPHLDSGELVELLPDWTRPTLPFHAIYPPNRNQNARLSVFIDWLVYTFGQGPA